MFTRDLLVSSVFIAVACDWCRTVSITRSATNVSAAHLVTMVTQHVAHLVIVHRVRVRLPYLAISMCATVYLF